MERFILDWTRIGAASVLACGLLAGETADEFFERRVRPLLAEHCAQCHNKDLQSAEIDFSQPDTVLGSAVLGGDESSPLIRAVRYESPIKMPPASRLPDEKIEVLVNWVRMGAPWPGYEPTEDHPAAAAAESVHSDHWAFRQVVDPPVPDVGPSDWVRNDIDRFILARLGDRGLEAPGEAARLELLRRAKFGLLGLPPDLDEVRRFTEDGHGDALGRLVDDLLASPHYGERWGRHWLDVARYADSTGVDEDQPFGDSWRYRDYVVGALSEDLPFDEFVREQIAGDLFPAPEGTAVNDRGVVATGFLALGPMALAQRDPIQKKYDVVDEQIDTLSKAFLGLTVACARCHDHKFDPILTSDYYALAGILASTRTFDDWTRNGSRFYKHPLVAPADYERYRKPADAVGRLERIRRVGGQAALLRFVMRGPASLTARYMLGTAVPGSAPDLDTSTASWFREYLQPRPAPRPHLKRWQDAGTDRTSIAELYQEEILSTIADRIDSLGEWLDQAYLADGTAAEELPEFPSAPPQSLFYRDLFDDGGPFDLELEDVRDRLAEEDSLWLAKVDALIEEGRKALPEAPPMANSVAEGEVIRQRIFRRGQHRNQGALVPRRFPLVLAGTDQPSIDSGSGRRELAAWLASPENPLTARVMVNRIWLWHFGEGLVRTPNNFGVRGERPTHPLLLDWLAARFVESGWSVKAMHRLIMASATYRMTSAISTGAAEHDPENRLWSRFPRRRLTIEEVRDSYLSLSGRLDPAVGGDTDLGAGQLAEFDRNNRRIHPDDFRRRTVYLPLMRNKLPNLLGLFDFGDATTATGRRSMTNVAPQALYLVNSAFALRSAEGVAERLDGSAEHRVDLAYRLVLGRAPAANETERALQYLHSHPGGGRAWTSFCKMLLASNEFHYVE